MLVTVSGTTGSKHAGLAGVEDIAQDFWATRPRRPRRGRKIAGVAAGIANRYRIDPTLVRVGLVVAAIYGGAGIVVYLLGWLFLPEQDDEVSPFESLLGRGRSSTSAMFTVLLCLAFIPTFSWFFNGFVPGYLSLLVLGGALYLLHRNRGHLGREQASAQEQPVMPMPPVPPMPPTMPTVPTVPLATPASAGTTVPAPDQAPAPQPEQEPEMRTTPPAWDPLGAAPFAWDLPDPNPQLDVQEPEPPQQRRRKSRVGLVTVGLALIAMAGMGIAMSEGGWINAQHMVGVAMAILGLGMVVGSFVRGGRGLIGLAVPLSVVGIGLTAVSPSGWHGVGDIDITPTKISQVRPQYNTSAGSVDIDLTQLPEAGRVRSNIDVDLGDVRVVVPQNADVFLRCHTDVGEINCFDLVKDGINDRDDSRIVDYGDDGPGGLEVRMNIEVGAGSLEVTRG
jgi:phage shock protein PspC (stress-responsive transcriptional regulator)